MTEKIVEMAINASGIRDTARVLKINKSVRLKGEGFNLTNGK